MASVPQGKVIACDTETTGLNPWLGDQPFCITFCNEDGDTGYIYWEVDPYERKVIPDKKTLEEAKAFFANERITKVFHNSKFDIRMLATLGIEVRGKVEDTFFAVYCLRSNEPEFGLKPLAKKYLNFPDDDQSDLRESAIRGRHEAKKKGWSIAEKGHRFGPDPIFADYWLAEKDILLKYAVGDVERTMLLWKLLSQELEADPACKWAYERELELQHNVVYGIESRGVRINVRKTKKLILDNQLLMKKYLAELQAIAGQDFNPASYNHVSSLLYKKLGLECKVFTDKSKPSTNYEALSKLDHPVVVTLQNYLGAQKVIGSFFEKYLALAIPDDNGQHIIHPNFNQCGTTTGRFSGNNPNLMNVANNNKGKPTTPIAARSAFVPRFNHNMYCLDYNSQEVWIFADGSQDPIMLNALFSGRSIHDETAEALFGKEAIEAEKKSTGPKLLRIKAKLTNFGIIYGIGPNGLAELTKSTYEEAEEMLLRYKQAYPRIVPYFSELSQLHRRQGYIQTAFGRKIFMDPDWGYRACNYYVQGTAADVMKASMFKVQAFIQKHKLRAHILMTIHDELVIEIHKEDSKNWVLSGIKKCMEEHPELKIIKQIPVEISKVDGSWDVKRKLEI